MESRERVLEASDHEAVLTAVQANGCAIQFAAETLKGDREIVLAAVRQNGYALKYAAQVFWSDREVVQAAVQQDTDALEDAADVLLEDPSFATEAKGEFRLLKLTMLSGRSTVLA
eukprot:3034528-Amphidinium_carterae.1